MALIENIQREDLNPLEEAQGLQRLIKEFGLTHEQAAQAVGRSRSAATQPAAPAQPAPTPVQTMLMAGDIDMGHARALLALERAAQILRRNQIAAEEAVGARSRGAGEEARRRIHLTSPKPKKEKSRDLRRVEEELSDLLTAEVEVRVKKRVKRNGRVEETGEVVDPVRLAGGVERADRQVAGARLTRLLRFHAPRNASLDQPDCKRVPSCASFRN